MTANSDYIVDMFDEIVASVRLEYDLVNNLEPYYDYGHPIGILSKLTDKDKSDTLKFQKYPLIILIQDVEEDHNIDEEESGIKYSFAPRIIILEKTKQNYTSQERYTNVFKPTLYPICELLISKIQSYGHFYIKSSAYLNYKKTDRVFWGTSNIFGNTGNIFNDRLDGIELIFDEIKVNRYTKQNCSLSVH